VFRKILEPGTSRTIRLAAQVTAWRCVVVSTENKKLIELTGCRETVPELQMQVSVAVAYRGVKI
jgi:hypothetical protein